MSSKLEINVRSLIAQCEEMIGEDGQDWRLKKYIRSLDTMIFELEQQFENPEDKSIAEYRKRCAELKKASNYVEPESSSEQRRLRSKNAVGFGGDSGDDVMREIRQVHDQKFQKELRNELFNGKTIRRRAGQKVVENLEQSVKQYSDVQEKIAEDMLLLTRNLKEQTETANKIIKKDTEIVSKSAKLTDQNMTSLSNESAKLQESSQKAWKCWMWLMIGFVMMVFIFVVLFMKIMKKKNY
ncbi:vesicle transport protein USE1 [Uranotaenia lowii]|uniref:vesicle transport protein USE1 n=1 Tax=Uranotaenia lowii TaxID=190385 RepID=UPI00247A40B9|nr:vesicle transport protein USE1 [Uranotaenia lowii]XP_055609530.1 vesicle transport protein USE1 [Uranotaenia lowii]XP_055609531.1 vesicle transport protein USE1 [Uranotaenia lowii]XP_055609532.1 vesicle transport protein USE1 [Uranotaenia lowii]